MKRKMYRIIKADKDVVFVYAEAPSLALEAAGVKGYYKDIQIVTEAMIDEMDEAQLDKLDAAYPPEVAEMVEEVMRAFGTAMGEATAEWCERVLNGEDIEG